jgi:hypothetical protein
MGRVAGEVRDSDVGMDIGMTGQGIRASYKNRNADSLR